MHRVLQLLLIACLLFAGSAVARDRRMLEASEQHPQPAVDTALVVFVRTSIVGAAIDATIYEVHDDGQRFLGIVSNKTRLAARVPAGAHRFMVVAENADFVEAQLEAGKTYYVLVSPRPGFWKARFSLLPVRNDTISEHNIHSQRFAKALGKTTLVEIGPDAEAWYREHRGSVDAKRVQYLQKWQRMAPADKAELTLHAADGV